MSREQEVIDQRAWVGIRNIQPLSGRIGFMAEVINTGKTPAYVTGIWKNAKFLKGRRTELPDHPVYDSETDLPNGAGVDFPGQVAIQIALSAPDYAVDKEPNEIRDGKTTLVFYGRVEYRDVFDNNHWTTFCYHYMLSWVGGPPAAFVPCKRNNATDHQH
jgi:hypothetical protein